MAWCWLVKYQLCDDLSIDTVKHWHGIIDQLSANLYGYAEDWKNDPEFELI